MKMRWTDFLSDNHIPWVSRGPNTKKGELSVKCPWCGEEDPSEHLGINLTSNAWGCHRNQAHRGKSITYLIQGLLHCSQSQAGLIMNQYDQADPDTLDQALAALGEAPEPAKSPPDRLILPRSFRPISNDAASKRFYNYLASRGFDDPEAVANFYNLKYCATDRWKDRIIFPVYQRSKLVAWTGRLTGTSLYAPRYLSTDLIKSFVFNEDELRLGGNTLFITEGPIDAIKMDYYGRHHSSMATCVFGTSITIDQISRLRSLSKKFAKTVLLMDPEAMGTAFDINGWLPEAVVGTLPSGVEDPGALTEAQVISLVRTST